jgi:hypothetical protein
LNEEVIINTEDGYINMGKLCLKYKKRLNDWFENEKTKELIECLKSRCGNSRTGLHYEIKGHYEFQGTYMSAELAVHVASWHQSKIGNNNIKNS